MTVVYDFIAPNMTLGEFRQILLDLEARHNPAEHGKSELFFNPLDDKVYIDMDVQHEPELELGGLGTGVTLSGMRKVVDQVLSEKGLNFNGSFFKLEPREDGFTVFSFMLPDGEATSWVLQPDGTIIG
ncbi:MAG: hypothetical protein ACYCW6_01670 [Candidatus Xenobia bacterium]